MTISWNLIILRFGYFSLSLSLSDDDDDDDNVKFVVVSSGVMRFDSKRRRRRRRSVCTPSSTEGILRRNFSRHRLYGDSAVRGLTALR